MAASPPLCFLEQEPPPSPPMLLFVSLFFTLSLISLLILISYLFYYSNHTTTTKKENLFTNKNTTNLDDDKLSPKWATLIKGVGDNDPITNGSGSDSEFVECESECGKKKKKRVKKKKVNVKVEDEVKKDKKEVVCLYPFTTSSSATQRKIKQHYDQLVKSHQANALTLAQVGHFVHVLTEARNELQHKSGVIQRKYTITKALLSKAERSSFDRLRQQIYKLEMEQKRLEEDVSVYNWLQQQLKLSPAFKRMLEIGACVELKAKTVELEDNADTTFADISFEELLAKEKKDSFWQKKGRPISCTGK
ncbi:CA-responsive protein [Heracleum sosnowskyi]|uniref:CA-responsive protein n=1 Tax=Heracleum sosnowskyi TaxID=360622 RepID=A0AAD8MHA3_9APIA|nr:CA-responsive protein [Heracleum sosnowskyi]